MSIKKLVLFAICSISYCYALDVERLPESRAKQYDSGLIEKIVVFSAPRTGSSLLFNVFKYFFEHTESLGLEHHRDHPLRKVLKTHNKKCFDIYDRKTTLFVVPIRDPLKAALSHARVGGLASFPEKKRAELLIESQVDRLSYAKNKQKNDFQVIFFRYEQFEDNLQFLLDQIEQIFSLSINQLDREKVLLGYSKENVELEVRSLDHFQNFLPLSGFHGEHIRTEDIAISENLLFWLNYYFSKKGFLYED